MVGIVRWLGKRYCTLSTFRTFNNAMKMQFSHRKEVGHVVVDRPQSEAFNFPRWSDKNF